MSADCLACQNGDGIGVNEQSSCVLMSMVHFETNFVWNLERQKNHVWVWDKAAKSRNCIKFWVGAAVTNVINTFTVVFYELP